MPRRREIDDRQAPKSDRHARLGVDPLAGIIGPAVHKGVAHAAHRAEHFARGCRA